MALITLRNVCFSTGNQLLLDHVNFAIEAEERIALIGRNGAGKSTLMKLISKEIEADSGEVMYRSGLVVSRLEQEVPQNMGGTIFSVVAEGLGADGQHLLNYLALSAQLETLSIAQHDELAALPVNWQSPAKIDNILSRLDLDGKRDFASLSGGMKRRVLLGRALVADPDVLLLDEPTNHLDIEAILWLEKFLLNASITLLFVTHDRALLQKLATRIVELDRGALTSFPGNFATYQSQKAAMLETQSTHNALFDKKLAQEEVWIRQGIKARRTRNEGRVRALEKLREIRGQRREVLGKASLQASLGERSGQLVLQAKNIHHALSGRVLIDDFSMILERGDKVGIIGPNGCGKTTLINILLQKIKPDSGQVRLGQNLQIAYFDQLRDQLDPERSVADNVMEGSVTITINGEKKHIIGYLQDFLFAPERARAPVKVLSGGERNRLLLAKLFAKPANVLVLDEPTNDLDAETLELLEELLVNYTGTLIIVSHDRDFLNNVVTSSIAFEGEGRVFEYVGGYDDWLRQRRTPAPASSPPLKPSSARVSLAPAKTRGLSFSQAHELKTLEAEITVLEAEIEQLQTKVGTAEFYQLDMPTQQQSFKMLKDLELKLQDAMTRWEALEAQR